MKMKPLPDINLLRELLTYNPESGELRWKTNKQNRQGKVAGTRHKHGHICVCWKEGDKKHAYYAHRIAYALHHGVDPYPMEIDHCNQNPSDNTINNLRIATRSINNKNRRTWERPDNRKSVRITYPDGRGVMVVDSVATASKILNIDGKQIHRIAHRKNNQILYPHPTRPTLRIPSGIHIAYI